jgi:hypothetical protein
MEGANRIRAAGIFRANSATLGNNRTNRHRDRASRRLVVLGKVTALILGYQFGLCPKAPPWSSVLLVRGRLM